MIKEPLKREFWESDPEGYYDECIEFLKSGKTDLILFREIKKKCDERYLEFLDYIEEMSHDHYGEPPPEDM